MNDERTQKEAVVAIFVQAFAWRD